MYEWDEAKRKANLNKHGFDFVDAHFVYESSDKLTLASERKNESRSMDLALVEIAGVLLALVYVIRADVVRVISFRPASSQERRQYAAIKSKEHD